ncbi:MAG: hypothetical protein LBH16_10050 [Treponema sp.]|jgi:hypothetical protein|nr:hypothetical protein [Treponema sp.]
MKINLRFLLVLLAVYSIVLGIRVFWLTQKNGFHVDEGMTIALANYKDYIINKNYEYEKEYTGKEIKEESFGANDSFSDVISDIKSLWKDNRDPPHTNLYYSLLRISLTGIRSADIKPVIFRGAVLNLILFTVSFTFFFLLIRILFPGSVLLQYTAVLCAFLSTAAISNTLFIRPYQIQETMFIVLSYYFIKTMDLQNGLFSGSKRFIVMQLIFYAFITGITLLTGYYTVIFIGLLGLYAVTVKYREKRYKVILFYFFILVMGLITAKVLYPGYYAGFGSYRGTETIRTISANVTENLKHSTAAAVTLLKDHFFAFQAIAFCLLCAGYIVFKKIKMTFNRHALFLFLAALLYFIVTLAIAPYKILRYGMPVFPFFVILPVMLIGSIHVKSRKIAAIAAVLLCCCFLPGAFNKNKIENLFFDKPAQYAFAQDANTPVYILMFYFRDWGYTATWKYGNLVPYLNNDQKYFFIRDYSELDSAPYDEIYVVIENIPPLQEFTNANFEIIEEFEIFTGEPETPSGLGNYFICKKVRKKPKV